MATTQNAQKFRNYLAIILENEGRIQRMKTIMVVKQRVNGIEVDIHSDPNYADYSGATNGGTIFSARTFKHELDPESLKKWNALLSNKEESEKLFQILAKENGIEANIDNKKIYAIVNHKINRIIYSLE